MHALWPTYGLFHFSCRFIRPHALSRTLLTNITAQTSDHHVPIFTSLPFTLPSIPSLSEEIGLRKTKPETTPATSKQMMEITPLRSQNVPHLPFDTLLCILDYAHHSDLLALCRVSKTFHDCAWKFLDVRKTLSRSPGLARRVMGGNCRIRVRLRTALVGNALRSMTHLRSLKMTMGKQYSEMLVLCTARVSSVPIDATTTSYAFWRANQI